jgi:hypothetical protein
VGRTFSLNAPSAASASSAVVGERGGAAGGSGALGRGAAAGKQCVHGCRTALKPQLPAATRTLRKERKLGQLVGERHDRRVRHVAQLRGGELGERCGGGGAGEHAALGGRGTSGRDGAARARPLVRRNATGSVRRGVDAGGGGGARSRDREIGVVQPGRDGQECSAKSVASGVRASGAPPVHPSWQRQAPATCIALQ